LTEGLSRYQLEHAVMKLSVCDGSGTAVGKAASRLSFQTCRCIGHFQIDLQVTVV
jgi:hypothetical protein